ncbi:MAG: hypothetical protein FWE57_07580 [Chitinispirillia bacterium]|nr:hypothetical protein [Chitinispirillia bacterium]
MEILTENDLLTFVENKTIILGGKKESCEGIKYDFTLSKMVLTVESGHPRDIDHAVIKPGEIAFVMTEETLNLPDDVYCQLSAKRKLSLDGIVLLGGLIIDPNYKGKLIFGLYNLSSRNYPLIPGKKMVAGVFYKVDKKSDKKPESINCFSEELIKIVADTKPNSISAINATISNINDAIGRLNAEMQEVKKNIDRDDKWKEDFKGKITRITDLVEQIGKELATEISTRKDENFDVKKDQIELREQILPLSKIQKHFQFFKGVVVTIVTGVIVGGIVYLISKIGG